MSLAVKYRPQTLADLKGQSISVKFLSHLLLNNISKNIIFKGEYGTGKTTAARIYSKSLLCSQRTSINPCGLCQSCQSFNSGSNRDYLEFDAASKGSVETIRSLLESFNVPPIFSNKKIWVIDEAHSMSPKAWDSLLKTIEEPKEFQIVLFCTNYPEKIRPAITSRCHILELHRLNVSDSIDLIENIASLEDIEIDVMSKKLIAYFSKGHSRDVLKNLEHLSFYGAITESTCREVLFGSNFRIPLNLLNSILDDSFIDNADLLFSSISNAQKEYEVFLELILFLKSQHLYNRTLSSLSIDKIFSINDLAILASNVSAFCKKALLEKSELFQTIDSLILSTSISSILEFKFLLFLIYEKLNSRRFKILSNSPNTFDTKNKRRFTNTEQKIPEQKIPVYSHQLHSKYGFTSVQPLSKFILL